MSLFDTHIVLKIAEFPNRQQIFVEKLEREEQPNGRGAVYSWDAH